MRNKQVEFNPYILYQNCTVLATKYPFFNTKHPVIILRVSLFAVTPSHVASTKIECQNFSYVYRSRKHWECKYSGMATGSGRPLLYIIVAYSFKMRCRIKGDNECSQNITSHIKTALSNYYKTLLKIYTNLHITLYKKVSDVI